MFGAILERTFGGISARISDRIPEKQTEGINRGILVKISEGICE